MNAVRVAWLACCLSVAGLGAAQVALAIDGPEVDVARLSAMLAALDSDPALADKAALERFKARQALATLQAARSRDRGHALILANARVEAAQDAAQADLLVLQSAQLDRERDQIMIDASRRDAEAARREADLLRLQSLAREEEAQRLAESMQRDRLVAEQSAANLDAANAQASQAMKLAEARAHETALARREAELAAEVAADSLEASASPPPSRRSGARTIYSLAGSAFGSGSATLTAGAQASVRRLAASIGRKSVRIEGHTDNQGGDAANLALSQKRADAVRRVLLDSGVAAARIRSSGKGETDPLVDNGSAEGRARNRRVEIIVE